jgi:transcription-repair coupling factor (superfamily II helicase)
MKPVSLPDSFDKLLITGAADAAVPALTEEFLARDPAPVTILLAPEWKGIETWTDALELFAGWSGRPAPRLERLPDMGDLADDDPRAFELRCDVIAALTALREATAAAKKSASAPKPDGPPEAPRQALVLATTPAALFQACPDPKSMAKGEVKLRPGQRISLTGLAERLGSELGYDSEAVCETPGQFAVRGGLIDVYPLNAPAPLRIDFFGDEIESIRTFDPTTQRSEDPVAALTIASAHAGLDTPKRGTVLDYLPPSIRWVLRQPDKLEAAYSDLFQIPENIAAPSRSFQTVIKRREGQGDHWIGLTDVETTQSLFPAGTPARAVESESMEGYRTFADTDKLGIVRLEAGNESRAKFLRQLLTWQADGHRVRFVCRTDGEESRLREILAETPAAAKLKPDFLSGNLPEGFRLADGGERVVYATESEVAGRKRLYISRRRRKLPERHQVDQLLDFSELADGDYLVHLQHGVCIFRGLQRIDTGKKEEEVISLEFDEGITLHVRLHESHLLSRYVGLSKASPKLGRLGTNAWDKTRRAAERATLDLAAQLLSLQAERNSRPGHAFTSDQPWQHSFEDAFPYRETPDQLTAINATKGDMEKPQPMDRLICGDVGFGKTEVALRAAMKAILDGKQVAVMLPTTVLCQQMFNNFKERFADYPITVEMLSGFRTGRQQTEIKRQLQQGDIDIVVGTHSLIGKAVHFRDLGLLIIDEEHRFGVRQKEKLKLMRHHIDVLSMSATPIPRTLYFALVGAREMSVIETPPRDRLPIQTIVKAYDPKLVKEAIEFEVRRGGQVFYLHNRVTTIDVVANRLQEMLPDLRIGVGHGQMGQGELEKVMTRFVAGEFDVLVSTTIIESGLDIPNSNTIIIEGADRFGLSQLYQLRGRVGRFNRQAFAYLLLHRHTRLLDVARKRLGAIRQFNQLGAGFRIAMRDLELRGAGNILGAQQSGHIAGVGFDLYCQLLRQSVARLKGDSTAALIRANVRLDFVLVGEYREGEAAQETPDRFHALKADELSDQRGEVVEAFIPVPYIGEARLRIDFYRRLALASSLEQVAEAGAEMKDRFGPWPEPVKCLLKMTEIRCLAERNGISLVETEGNRLKCRLANAREGAYVQIGNRFPRLTAKKPLAKLTEIQTFLKTLPNQTPA